MRYAGDVQASGRQWSERAVAARVCPPQRCSALTAAYACPSRWQLPGKEKGSLLRGEPLVSLALCFSISQNLLSAALKGMHQIFP